MHFQEMGACQAGANSTGRCGKAGGQAACTYLSHAAAAAGSSTSNCNCRVAAVAVALLYCLGSSGIAASGSQSVSSIPILQFATKKLSSVKVHASVSGAFMSESAQ